MTDNTIVQSDASPHFRETYLRKRSCQHNANRAVSAMWSTTSSNSSSWQTDTHSRKKCSPITIELDTTTANAVTHQNRNPVIQYRQVYRVFRLDIPVFDNPQQRDQALMLGLSIVVSVSSIKFVE